MSKRNLIPAIVMAVVGVVLMRLQAADTAPAPNQEAVKVLSDLHHANQMEVEMGKLAEKRGSADAVKKFGDTLVSDHSDADKKVTELAKNQNIKLPAENMPMGNEKKMTAHLKSLQGKDFDRAFAQAMVDDHRKDISTLQSAQSKLTGTPTGDLVTELLPTLEKHEQIAMDLVNTLK